MNCLEHSISISLLFAQNVSERKLCVVNKAHFAPKKVARLDSTLLRILCCFLDRKKCNNAQFCKSKPSLLQSRVWVFLQQNILPKSIYGKLILLRNPTVFNFARFVQLKFHPRFIIMRHWPISRLKEHKFWKTYDLMAR